MRPLIILFLLVSITASAQRNCGSVEYVNSKGASSFNMHRDNSGLNALSTRDTIRNEIITIPVVFHILYNSTSQNISDAQVMSQLNVMNDDFRRLNRDASNTPDAFKSAGADCRIMFCLAQVDPKGRPSKGIIRKYTSRSSFSVSDAMKSSVSGGSDTWDASKYLNVWVCNMQSNCIGFATPPGGQAEVDGVVIQYDCFGTMGTLRPAFNKGRTATHEIGHWMGLRHIWGDESCGSDEVDDTPSQSGYNYNCPVYPKRSNCSPDNNGDMFMNFMDYTNDGCMNMFTYGQKTKMRSCFAKGNARNSFLKSYACDSSLASGASLPAEETPAVETVKVKSVTVFPNPVQDKINLSALNGYDLNGKTVRLFNMAGRQVLTQKMNGQANQLSVPTLTQGIYMLVVGEGAEKVIIKIMKS